MGSEQAGGKGFGRGDFVRVINEDSEYYDMIFIVKNYAVKCAQYCVLSERDSELHYFDKTDLVPVLDSQTFKKVTLEFLHQVAVHAVDLGDREWFDSICERINLINNFPTSEEKKLNE